MSLSVDTPEGERLNENRFPGLRPEAASPPAVAWPLRVLLPNLCVAVFTVALLQVLVVSGGSHTLFRDSDTGWHIRIGEQILDRGAVPRTDPFSFTREGRPWIAWEWLSDAALGVTHRLAGLPGVALLSATVIAATALASIALALGLGANFFLAAGGAALLLGSTSIHWLARPHVFSWLLALTFVAAAESRSRDGKQGPLPAMPLVSALWANVHPSFLLGPAILGIYAAGHLLRRERKPARDLAVVSLISLAATFANPYGWRLHAHVFSYLRNTYLMDRISEFRSFSFHSPGAFFVEGFLLVAAAGGLVALRRRAYPQALLTFALLHMALYSARHLPTAAVILLPLSLSWITAELRAMPGPRLSDFLAYSDRLRAWDRRIIGVAPLVLAVLLAAAGLAWKAGSAGFDPQTFPVQAAGFFEGRENQVRLFARDQWGGYLIYRFGGRLKVFVDGRSDFYGNDFLERYGQVADVKPGWEQALDEERVNCVLVAPGQALAQALRLSGRWHEVHADAVAVLFERVPG